MNNNILESSIRYLKGVGEQREKIFNKLGIFTFRDLAGFFPRAYEDRTVFKAIGSLAIGESACVKATAASGPVLSSVRRGLSLVKFNAADETGTLAITYFNAPFVKNAIKQGETYVFYGRVSGTLLRPEMTNPVFEIHGGRGDSGGHGDREGRGDSGGHGDRGDSGDCQPDSSVSTKPPATGCIVPVYPLTAKLTQKALASAIYNVLQKCGDMLPDVLPGGISAEYQLCRARYAYWNIHFPKSFKELDIARRRLIFEELFVLTAAMKLMRRRRGTAAGQIVGKPQTDEFYQTLPFAPTYAQKRAVDEALGDMSSGLLMNRLVQGDVGSGKTLVAAACAWAVRGSGGQSAFMAPTEILAAQHFATLKRLLGPLGMNIALLTGAMTAKAKRGAYDALLSGETDLVVGTHALLSKGVAFKNLALVITDEQHRFGVAQRAMLSEKGSNPQVPPHLLLMSATPIPRTLALIIYGDLSVSIIDEMPPGRSAVETHITAERHRQRAYGFVRKLVGEGRQVYIICPKINDLQSGPDYEYDIEAARVKPAEEYYKALQNEVFPDLRVALVHGKMPAKEKDAAMSRFVSGGADILVATTVVEVGVDVPNAALILIENADRYGLSQLHQLRGRVGRGEHKSYCILMKTENQRDQGDCIPDSGLSGPAPGISRLKIMKSTNDGFKIAEEDLKLRGPGDFFGSRQHGLPKMRIANLTADMIVLHEASKAAEDVLQRDPELELPEHKPLAAEIDRMFGSGILA